ncbi:aldehyde dehydrogenase [Coniochaeta sp. PMI_546]|nr:aldehyde dehydrogenase [Coniochaeta sp. PMI_546]
MSTEPEGRLFINNKFQACTSGLTTSVINPFNHAIVTSSVHCAGKDDVDLAVEAAAAAYKSWRKTAPTRRAELLHRLADLVDQNVKELGSLETCAMGAPSFIAEHGARSLAQSLRYYAGWTDKLGGSAYPDHSGDGTYQVVNYEPLGVCAGIAAWNATFVFIGWKVAPAIAAGNTYVFKISEKSPLGALALGRLVVEAGFPPGVINFINGMGEAGGALASHMKVAKVSFTGSTATGRGVQIAAASSNLKKCTLELGGKSAALVFDDANIDNALSCLSQGFLINTTQVCAATTRLLVQDTIADDFISKLKTRFEQASASFGDPTLPDTLGGPVADKAQFERIMGFIDSAKHEGVRLVTGGKRLGKQGYFVQPTLFVDPPVSSAIYREEIFGPVLCVLRFKTEEEAITMANDSNYGLGASVYTGSIARGLRISQEIEAGMVGINQPLVPENRVPMGGTKQSGYGRENGKEGIMAYLDTKTVSISMKA